MSILVLCLARFSGYGHRLLTVDPTDALIG